jgi:hypothetical protein
VQEELRRILSSLCTQVTCKITELGKVHMRLCKEPSPKYLVAPKFKGQGNWSQEREFKANREGLWV